MRKKDKHLYDHHYDRVYDDDNIDDDIPENPPSRKAIAIGAIITLAVVLGALRLWNVFQRP